MGIFSGLEEIVKEDYPLAKETWYGLGGAADYFIRPTNVEQLREVVSRCNENNIAMRILGLGSNLLVSDKGVRAAVIKLDKGDEFKKCQFNGANLTAGAGVELSKIVLECVERGLSGLEPLTGIPGSVGGSIMMNAGGRFGDIGGVVESAMLMDSNGNVFEKAKPELMFDYRKTNITVPFVLSAKMVLAESEPDQIMRTVKEIWIFKKNNQPLNTKNSGCIFKNPGRGVSAGALIDRAGMKGFRVGGAVVSEKHANFIIAEKNCKSKDVMKVIEAIKQKVKEAFDVELELEIQIWD